VVFLLAFPGDFGMRHRPSSGAVDRPRRYNIFVFRSDGGSVGTENPRIMGQGQKQIAGLRPLDEPIGHGDPWPLGTKSHRMWFLREGDKGIDIGADFYSWETERVLV
jgi:hypothetical protein